MLQGKQKTAAWITVFAFLVTNTLLPVPPVQAAAGEPSFSPWPSVAEIPVPANIGKIQEAFGGSSGQTVILVQDAHGIPEAQRNIRNLIDYFQQTYGLKIIALEGAASRLNPRIFRSFPDPEILKTTFKEYLENGELTGTTMAAIFNEREGDFFGIEDWPLYEQGYAAFLESMEQSPAVLEKIEAQDRLLRDRQKAVYSEKLYQVSLRVREFHRNSSDLMSVLQALSEIRKPEAGSELALMLEESSRSEESQIPVEIEVKRMAEGVKQFFKSAPAGDPRRTEAAALFNEKHQAFQLSSISAQEFALFLRDLALELHIPIRASEALKHQARRQKRMKDIEGTRFFDAFERYVDQVEENLFENDSQRALRLEERFLERMRKLATLEITREQWQALQGDFNTDGPGASYRDLSTTHRAFYVNAEARDDAFVTNLLKIFKNRNDSTVLFVAGGFHTEGLVSRLKARGISYLLVMPEISELPPEIHYKDHMRGLVSWKDYYNAETGTVNVYEAFVRATRDRMTARASDEGRMLKNWRDEIIRDLAAENKVAEAGRYTRFIDEKAREGEEGEAALLDRIEAFALGLKQLEANNQLNQQNILNLLRPATIADQSSPQIAEGTIYQGFRLLNGVWRPESSLVTEVAASVDLVTAGKSELRAASPVLEYEKLDGLLAGQITFDEISRILDRQPQLFRRAGGVASRYASTLAIPAGSLGRSSVIGVVSEGYEYEYRADITRTATVITLDFVPVNTGWMSSYGVTRPKGFTLDINASGTANFELKSNELDELESLLPQDKAQGLARLISDFVLGRAVSSEQQEMIDALRKTGLNSEILGSLIAIPGLLDAEKQAGVFRYPVSLSAVNYEVVSTFGVTVKDWGDGTYEVRGRDPSEKSEFVIQVGPQGVTGFTMAERPLGLFDRQQGGLPGFARTLAAYLRFQAGQGRNAVALEQVLSDNGITEAQQVVLARPIGMSLLQRDSSTYSYQAAHQSIASALQQEGLTSEAIGALLARPKLFTKRADGAPYVYRQSVELVSFKSFHNFGVTVTDAGNGFYAIQAEDKNSKAIAFSVVVGPKGVLSFAMADTALGDFIAQYGGYNNRLGRDIAKGLLLRSELRTAESDIQAARKALATTLDVEFEENELRLALQDALVFAPGVQRPEVPLPAAVGKFRRQILERPYFAALLTPNSRGTLPVYEVVQEVLRDRERSEPAGTLHAGDEIVNSDNGIVYRIMAINTEDGTASVQNLTPVNGVLPPAGQAGTLPLSQLQAVIARTDKKYRHDLISQRPLARYSEDDVQAARTAAEAILRWQFEENDLRLALLDELTFPRGAIRPPIPLPAAVARFQQEVRGNPQFAALFIADDQGVLPIHQILQQIIRESESEGGALTLHVGDEIISRLSGNVRRVLSINPLGTFVAALFTPVDGVLPLTGVPDTQITNRLLLYLDRPDSGYILLPLSRRPLTRPELRVSETLEQTVTGSQLAEQRQIARSLEDFGARLANFNAQGFDVESELNRLRTAVVDSGILNLRQKADLLNFLVQSVIDDEDLFLTVRTAVGAPAASRLEALIRNARTFIAEADEVIDAEQGAVETPVLAAGEAPEAFLAALEALRGLIGEENYGEVIPQIDLLLEGLSALAPGEQLAVLEPLTEILEEAKRDRGEGLLNVDLSQAGRSLGAIENAIQEAYGVLDRSELRVFSNTRDLLRSLNREAEIMVALDRIKNALDVLKESGLERSEESPKFDVLLRNFAQALHLDAANEGRFLIAITADINAYLQGRPSPATSYDDAAVTGKARRLLKSFTVEGTEEAWFDQLRKDLEAFRAQGVQRFADSAILDENVHFVVSLLGLDAETKGLMLIALSDYADTFLQSRPELRAGTYEGRELEVFITTRLAEYFTNYVRENLGNVVEPGALESRDFGTNNTNLILSQADNTAQFLRRAFLLDKLDLLDEDLDLARLRDRISYRLFLNPGVVQALGRKLKARGLGLDTLGKAFDFSLHLAMMALFSTRWSTPDDFKKGSTEFFDNIRVLVPVILDQMESRGELRSEEDIQAASFLLGIFEGFLKDVRGRGLDIQIDSVMNLTEAIDTLAGFYRAALVLDGRFTGLDASEPARQAVRQTFVQYLEKHINDELQMAANAAKLTGRPAQASTNADQMILSAAFDLQEALVSENGERSELRTEEAFYFGLDLITDEMASNAAKVGKKLTVSISQVDDGIEIIFDDNGPGWDIPQMVEVAKAYYKLYDGFPEEDTDNYGFLERLQFEDEDSKFAADGKSKTWVDVVREIVEGGRQDWEIFHQLLVHKPVAVGFTGRKSEADVEVPGPNATFRLSRNGLEVAGGRGWLLSNHYATKYQGTYETFNRPEPGVGFRVKIRFPATVISAQDGLEEESLDLLSRLDKIIETVSIKSEAIAKNRGVTFVIKISRPELRAVDPEQVGRIVTVWSHPFLGGVSSSLLDAVKTVYIQGQAGQLSARETRLIKALQKVVFSEEREPRSLQETAELVNYFEAAKNEIAHLEEVMKAARQSNISTTGEKSRLDLGVEFAPGVGGQTLPVSSRIAKNEALVFYAEMGTPDGNMSNYGFVVYEGRVYQFNPVSYWLVAAPNSDEQALLREVETGFYEFESVEGYRLFITAQPQNDGTLVNLSSRLPGYVISLTHGKITAPERAELRALESFLPEIKYATPATLTVLSERLQDKVNVYRGERNSAYPPTRAALRDQYRAIARAVGWTPPGMGRFFTQRYDGLADELQMDIANTVLEAVLFDESGALAADSVIDEMIQSVNDYAAGRAVRPELRAPEAAAESRYQGLSGPMLQILELLGATNFGGIAAPEASLDIARALVERTVGVGESLTVTEIAQVIYQLRTLLGDAILSESEDIAELINPVEFIGAIQSGDRARVLEALELTALLGWPVLERTVTTGYDAARWTAAITPLLADENREVVRAAAFALSQIPEGFQAASDFAARQEIDPQSQRELALGLTLSNSGVIGALPALVARAQNQELPQGQRISAIESIRGLGPAAVSAVPSLMDLLTSADAGILRSFAAQALARIGPAAGSVLPALIDSLQNENAPVGRGIVLSVLANIGTGSAAALPALTAILAEDPEPGPDAIYQQRQIVDILSRIGPAAEAATGRLVELLQSRRHYLEEEEFLPGFSPVRAEAARALGAIGNATEPVIEGLTRLLRDPNSVARGQAGLSLAALGRNQENQVINLLRGHQGLPVNEPIRSTIDDIISQISARRAELRQIFTDGELSSFPEITSIVTELLGKENLSQEDYEKFDSIVLGPLIDIFRTENIDDRFNADTWTAYQHYKGVDAYDEKPFTWNESRVIAKSLVLMKAADAVHQHVNKLFVGRLEQEGRLDILLNLAKQTHNSWFRGEADKLLRGKVLILPVDSLTPEEAETYLITGPDTKGEKFLGRYENPRYKVKLSLMDVREGKRGEFLRLLVTRQIGILSQEATAPANQRIYQNTIGDKKTAEIVRAYEDILRELDRIGSDEAAVTARFGALPINIVAQPWDTLLEQAGRFNDSAARKLFLFRQQESTVISNVMILSIGRLLLDSTKPTLDNLALRAVNAFFRLTNQWNSFFMQGDDLAKKDQIAKAFDLAESETTLGREEILRDEVVLGPILEELQLNVAQPLYGTRYADAYDTARQSADFTGKITAIIEKTGLAANDANITAVGNLLGVRAVEYRGAGTYTVRLVQNIASPDAGLLAVAQQVAGHSVVDLYPLRLERGDVDWLIRQRLEALGQDASEGRVAAVRSYLTIEESRFPYEREFVIVPREESDPMEFVIQVVNQRQLSERVSDVIKSALQPVYFPGQNVDDIVGVDIGSFYRGTNAPGSPADIDTMVFLKEPGSLDFWRDRDTYEMTGTWDGLTDLEQVRTYDPALADVIVNTMARLESSGIGRNARFHWVRTWGDFPGLVFNVSVEPADASVKTNAQGRIEFDVNLYYEEYFGTEHSTRFIQAVDSIQERQGRQAVVDLLEDIRALKSAVRRAATNEDGKLDKLKKVPGFVVEALFFDEAGNRRSFKTVIRSIVETNLEQAAIDGLPEKIANQQVQLIGTRLPVAEVLTKSLTRGGYATLKEAASELSQVPTLLRDRAELRAVETAVEQEPSAETIQSLELLAGAFVDRNDEAAVRQIDEILQSLEALASGERLGTLDRLRAILESEKESRGEGTLNVDLSLVGSPLAAIEGRIQAAYAALPSAAVALVKPESPAAVEAQEPSAETIQSLELLAGAFVDRNDETAVRQIDEILQSLEALALGERLGTLDRLQAILESEKESRGEGTLNVELGLAGKTLDAIDGAIQEAYESIDRARAELRGKEGLEDDAAARVSRQLLNVMRKNGTATRDELRTAAEGASVVLNGRLASVDELIVRLRDLARIPESAAEDLMSQAVYENGIDYLLDVLRTYLESRALQGGFTIALDLPEASELQDYVDPVKKLEGMIGRLVIRGDVKGAGSQELIQTLGGRLTKTANLSRIQTTGGQLIIPQLSPQQIRELSGAQFFGIDLNVDAEILDPRIRTYAALLQMILGIMAASEIDEPGEVKLPGERLKEAILKPLALFQQYQDPITGGNIFNFSDRGVSISLSNLAALLTTDYFANKAVKTAA